MKVDISVFDPNEDRVISFSDYQIAHVACGAMTSNHLISPDDYVLRCTICDLEIGFPCYGDAEKTITQGVIDGGEARALKAKSFCSNWASAVRVQVEGV